MLSRIDAIEGSNARSLCPQDKRRVQEFAAARHLLTTAGSDAQATMEIGPAYQQIPTFTSAEEFRATLPESTVHGRLSPTWAQVIILCNKLRTRLRLRLDFNTSTE